MGTRLIFLDSSREMLENYQTLFSASFEVRCFSCPEKALAHASRNQVEVIISNSDLLEKGSGIHFLRRVKEHLKLNAEGILITDNDQPGQIRKSEGSIPTFNKKFQLFELFDYIYCKYCEQQCLGDRRMKA